MLKLILASQSPRRKELLTRAGFEFQTIAIEISENFNENLSLDDALQELAQRKAKALIESGKLPKQQSFLILSADTVVVLEKKIFGKPKDFTEACDFLRRLSGKTHEVKTAVCLWNLDSGRVKTSVETTKVEFKKLSEEQIVNYVNSGEPMDKAGAYAIQGLAGAFVKNVEGPMDNVVGLPVETVEKILIDEKWDVKRENSLLVNNFSQIRAKISQAALRCHREPEEIQLIAVSKTKPASMIEEAFQKAKQIHFAENYVQEFLEKYESLKNLPLQWHFIGGLQANKVKFIIGKINLIHSVDRWSLAQEIQKQAQKLNVVQNILIQVNLVGEVQKGGVSPEELPELIKKIKECSYIQLQGLMLIPPIMDNKRELANLYQQMRQLAVDHKTGPELSMGMSDDFEIAIENGSTMVRVGSALFGARN